MIRVIRWTFLVTLINVVWFCLVYILSSVFISPVGAVTVDLRKPVYFADWTDSQYDWRIAEAVKNWNRNSYVKLTQVSNCEGYTPCVTIIDEFGGYERFGFPTGSIAGLFWAEMDANWNDSNNVIELYTWPYDENPIAAGNPYNFQRLSCHELGHFLLQSIDHPNYGCLGSDGNKYRSGKYLRSLLNVWTQQ